MIVFLLTALLGAARPGLAIAERPRSEAAPKTRPTGCTKYLGDLAGDEALDAETIQAFREEVLATKLKNLGSAGPAVRAAADALRTVRVLRTHDTNVLEYADLASHVGLPVPHSLVMLGPELPAHEVLAHLWETLGGVARFDPDVHTAAGLGMMMRRRGAVLTVVIPPTLYQVPFDFDVTVAVLSDFHQAAVDSRILLYHPLDAPIARYLDACLAH